MKHYLYDSNHKRLLKSLLFKFNNQNLRPCCSIEFEFYIKNIDNSDSFLSDIKNFADNRGILINDIVKEASENQFEIAMQHSFDIIKISEQYLQLKELMIELAQTYSLDLNFSGKPYGNDFHGNGMHLHISLYDDSNNNLYSKIDDNESEILLNSIAGLLKYMNSSLIFMNKDSSDFARYNSQINIENSKKRYSCNKSYAPTHICWGKNNRTVAIRIPDSVTDPVNRHIEYRVAVPNADPITVFLILLLQINSGISNKYNPDIPIHGNAFDKQYNLENIHNNFENALDDFNKSEFKDMLDRFYNLEDHKN
jgi:glutamine synthetase